MVKLLDGLYENGKKCIKVNFNMMNIIFLRLSWFTDLFNEYDVTNMDMNELEYEYKINIV